MSFITDALQRRQERRLAARFESLRWDWKRRTCFLSSSTDIAGDWNYRQIVAMGAPAVPLILKALQQEADHWFQALYEITGENPIPPGDEGRMEAMRQAWLAWGRVQGYLPEVEDE